MALTHMFPRIVQGSSRVQNRFLGKVEHLGYVEWHDGTALHDSLYLLDIRTAHNPTHLELAHNWRNLLLERLVRHFSAAKINLVANENDRHLMLALAVDITHIDTLFSKQWQPVLGDAVKARRLGYRVHQADDMGAGELRQEMGAGTRVR